MQERTCPLHPVLALSIMMLSRQGSRDNLHFLVGHVAFSHRTRPLPRLLVDRTVAVCCLGFSSFMPSTRRQMCDSELLFETGCGDVEAEAMKMPMPLASNGAPIHFFQAGRHFLRCVLSTFVTRNLDDLPHLSHRSITSALLRHYFS